MRRKFGFEPVIGECYHLYEVDGKYHLSMIEPEKLAPALDRYPASECRWALANGEVRRRL
jgi:hypothetical protein